MDKHKIILFDGICNLCNSSVNFIIGRDKKNVFKFAAMQSEAGQSLMTKFNLSLNEFYSVILIDNEKYYTSSTAVLRIAKELGFFWNILYVFIIVPTPVRNFFYNLIARNRYRWFGKKDSCRIPTLELKEKFL